MIKIYYKKTDERACDNALLSNVILSEQRKEKALDIAKEHPEYFIANSGEDVHLLLNLGNPLAFKYCFEQLSSIIEELRGLTKSRPCRC